MTTHQRWLPLCRRYLASIVITTMSRADKLAALRGELVELEASRSATGVPSGRLDEIVAGIARIEGAAEASGT
jgi:hypothetical protein